MSFGVKFINVLRMRFLYESVFKAKTQLQKRLLDVKFVPLTLMKLTTGVYFIKILRAAFMRPDPKSPKRYWRLDWIFTLLGSGHITTARKMSVKLTLGRHWHPLWTPPPPFRHFHPHPLLLCWKAVILNWSNVSFFLLVKTIIQFCWKWAV